MDFSYKPTSYGTPVFDRYLYESRYKAEPPKPSQTESNGFCLEDILGLDESRLLDKVVNTALSITYRLRLYEDSVRLFDSKWNEMSLAIGEVESFKVGYNANIDRRKSMLIKERNTLELKALENRLLAWKDMGYASNQFLTYFHKRLEGVQDKKILGGK